MSQAIAPALLRESEACSYLGIGRTSLWELIWAGKIKRVHVGRAMRIPRAELDRYIAERCAAAGIETFPAPDDTSGQAAA